MVRFARTGIIKRRAAAPLVEGEQELISRFPLRTRRQAFVATMLAAAIVLAVPSGARSQHVVAFVNGQPITILDVEHRSKFILLSTKKLPTRKEVLDSLIDEILEVTEAKRYSVEVPDSEVEKSYAAVATRMGVDAPRLTQILASGGASADTLKRRLRAQIAWTNLVRGRYKASLEIRDKRCRGAAGAAQARRKKTTSDTNTSCGPSFSLCRAVRPMPLMRPANTTPMPCARVFRTATTAFRLRALCTEVAVRDQVSKYSADLPQQLRDILDSTGVGHLTPPETTAEGVQMFAVCAKKETKSDTPGMKEIRDQMFQQKFGAQAKRYLERFAARGDDRIQIGRRQVAEQKRNRAALGIDARRARRDRPRPCPCGLASTRRTRRSAHSTSSPTRIFSAGAPIGSASTFRSPR